MKLDEYEELWGAVEEDMNAWCSVTEEVVTDVLDGMLRRLGIEIPEKPKSREEKRREILKNNVNTMDLYLMLCAAEGVSEEEAVERIMATDPDTIDQLLIRYHYPL